MLGFGQFKFSLISRVIRFADSYTNVITPAVSSPNEHSIPFLINYFFELVNFAYRCKATLRKKIFFFFCQKHFA